MLDIRRLRSEPDTVRAGLQRRGDYAQTVDDILKLDAARLEHERERDALRAEINRISKEVGQLFRDGRQDEANELKERSRELGARERSLDSLATELGRQIRDHLLVLPNLPADECPDGPDESGNVVLRVEGYDASAYDDHQRVPHWEVGEALGLLDLQRGAKLSGSMFVVYRGLGARLVRALVQLALDRNSDAFEEIRPPTLVRTETMVSTGHLPKFEDDAYHVERDDLWAIPTAEVPLTSMARDEILAEDELPVRMMAHTSCFRREAGAAGRDTRGLLRVHEFDKVEILAYAAPEQAASVHEDLLARAESVIADLGLAYRIVDICTGDLGRSSARTWDVEVYAPGVDQWLECSSVSWFSDYQARRANIRYRPAAGGSPAVVHTLNGSALAVPRVWAALVETYRQPDGSVAVPEVLHPYMGGHDRIPAPAG